MAGMAELQRRDFIDRIQRINDGGPNTLGTIYAGNVEDGGGAISQPKKKRKKRSFGLGSLLIWPMALLVGFLSMMSGRVGAYHLIATPELIPPEYQYLAGLTLDVTIAGLLLGMLAWAFKLGSGMRFVAMCAGFLAVMLGESLMVEQLPGVFAAIFSPEYVTAMQAQPSALEVSFPEFFGA